MHHIHLNIGSNQGDRILLIDRAVALIARAFPEATLATAPDVESLPWGYDSPHPFINRAVMLDIPGDLDPLDLLAITQYIEQQIGAATPHRHPDGSYADRLLDIDIIDFDGLCIDSPTLTLPHPHAAERPFVIEPLALLDPDTARRLRNH